VVQQYAEVLQLCLGRVRQNRFDLAGLQLAADLQALAASLGRCVASTPHPLLAQWQTTLQALVEQYAGQVAEIGRGADWLVAIRQVLDAAALPTVDARGEGGDQVALQMAHVLGPIMDEQNLTPWQQQVQTHLRRVSERYWSGVFVCYDQVGVPRTNNDLERMFGRMRRQARRQSGFGQLRRPLLRYGAWLIEQPCAADVAELQARLAAVPRAVYEQERARFEQRQARFQMRSRWQRKRDGVLADLEAQWSHRRADFTQ
jgi:hypothetical protein